MSMRLLAGKSRLFHEWRELAVFIFLPADVIWITGWYFLLSGVSEPQVIPDIYWIFVVSNCLAYLVLRLLFAWQAPVALRLALGALGLMIGLWLGENLLVYRTLIFDFETILSDIWTSFRGLRSLSAEFWALAAIILIWVRTIQYTHNPVTQDTIMGRLQFGLFMLLLLVLIFDSLGLTVFLTGLCLYLVLGLPSLGLARIADINLHRGGRRLRFSLDLFLALCGISTVLVVVSAALTILTSTWLSLAIIAVTGGILTIIRFIVEKLVVPLLTLVLASLYKLMEMVFHSEFRSPATVPEFEVIDPFKDVPPLDLNDPATQALQTAQPYFLAFLLVLAVVVIVLMLLRLPRKEGVNRAYDTGEKTGGNVWLQLRKLISKRVQDILEQVSRRVNIRRAVGLFWAARIRWIYHQFELFASRKGFPRQAAVTPMEYQAIVAPLFVDGNEDISLLTNAYQSVRYGELPEKARDVTRVSDAWDRLRHMKKLNTTRIRQHRRR